MLLSNSFRENKPLAIWRQVSIRGTINSYHSWQIRPRIIFRVIILFHKIGVKHFFFWNIGVQILYPSVLLNVDQEATSKGFVMVNHLLACCSQLCFLDGYIWCHSELFWRTWSGGQGEYAIGALESIETAQNQLSGSIGALTWVQLSTG